MSKKRSLDDDLEGLKRYQKDITEYILAELKKYKRMSNMEEWAEEESKKTTGEKVYKKYKRKTPRRQVTEEKKSVVREQEVDIDDLIRRIERLNTVSDELDDIIEKFNSLKVNKNFNFRTRKSNKVVKRRSGKRKSNKAVKRRSGKRKSNKAVKRRSGKRKSKSR